MTISERDKKYLVVLAVVLAVGMIYLLGYKPLDNRAAALESEVSAMESQVAQYQATLQTQEFYESGLKAAEEEIRSIDEKLPQDLPQELIIQTVDSISKDLKMVLPALSFTQMEQIPLSAAQGVAGENSETTQSSNQQTLMGLKTSITTATMCSYEEFKLFLKHIRDLPIEVALENVAVSTAENKLAVNFTMNLYGLQVPNRSKEFVALGEYVIGKRDIFNYYTKLAATEDEKIYEDFFMLVDPIYSDNTAITMGQVNDASRSSYLYEETNAPSEVVMNFTQENGKCYVQYQVGQNYYPKDGSKLAFNPSEAIGVNIRSSKRVSGEDKNEVQLTVNNQTNKTVHLYVRNDDSENPRIHLIKQTGLVKIKE